LKKTSTHLLVRFIFLLSSEKAINFITDKRKKAADAAGKIIDDIYALLSKGKQALSAFFEAIWKKIVDWFLKQKKAIQKVLDDVADLTAKELDWMASRKMGNLGGNILKATQIRKLRGFLQQKGIQLIVEGDVKSITKLFKEADGFKNADELFAFMKRKNLVGAFNSKTGQFFLAKECTELVAFHEQAHLKQFLELGEETYQTLNKLQKETYVFEQILANKNKWTRAELEDALKYLNNIRTDPKYGYNLEPLKIKI